MSYISYVIVYATCTLDLRYRQLFFKTTTHVNKMYRLWILLNEYFVTCTLLIVLTWTNLTAAFQFTFEQTFLSALCSSFLFCFFLSFRHGISFHLSRTMDIASSYTPTPMAFPSILNLMLGFFPESVYDEEKGKLKLVH